MPLLTNGIISRCLSYLSDRPSGYRLYDQDDADRIAFILRARALDFSLDDIGVPLAVTGLVPPVWAMAAMVASVSTVLLNTFGNPSASPSFLRAWLRTRLSAGSFGAHINR